ncbi:MAG: hypothetical protein ABJA78_01740 [Ferruginibacter sp.]
MLRAILELFVLYMVYKLIFDFIIPVYTTTKQVKKQFGDMQQKMSEMNRQQQQSGQYNSNTSTQPAQPKPGKDDYIEYEDVK